MVYIPEELQDGKGTDEDFIYHLRPYVSVLAHYVDDGLEHHWPHSAAKEKDVCLDLDDENPEHKPHLDKYEQTMHWGRSWVGWIWRELNRVSDLGKDNNRDYVIKIIRKVQTTIGQLSVSVSFNYADDIFIKPITQFYFGHHLEHWGTCLADLDDIGSRQIREVDSNGKCGAVWYDVNLANTNDEGVLDSEAAAKEWKELKTIHWDAALSFLRNYIKPPVFKTVDTRILNPTIGNPGNYSVTLSTLIDDHDHDSLTLEATSKDTNVATVSITDTHIVMTCVGGGTTTVELTAKNIKGKAVMKFNITCRTLPGA